MSVLNSLMKNMKVNKDLVNVQIMLNGIKLKENASVMIPHRESVGKVVLMTRTENV